MIAKALIGITKTVKETFNKTNKQQMKKTITLLSLLFIVATSFAQIPTNGLLAWYPFTGNAIDSSGNGNNGTVYGATLTTDRFGKANSAYYFDKGSNLICTQNSFSAPNDLSYSVWIKSSNTGGGFVIGFNNGQCLHGGIWDRQLWAEKNGLYFYTFPNYAVFDSASNNVLDNNWHHLVVTMSNVVGTKIYLDGILKGINYLQTIGQNYDGYFRIGGLSPNDVNNSLLGGYDDVRIYNRALDSTEVQALYHEGGYDLPKTTLPTNGLVAWYPFTGNAIDSSGNGNNGTVYGATLTTDRFGNANSAYSFSNSVSNGTRQNEIYIPYSPTFNIKNITLSAWVNQDEIVGYSYIISRFQYGYSNPNGQTWTLVLNDSNRVGAGFNPACSDNSCTGSSVFGSKITTKKWYHLVFSYDSKNLNLYINGILIGNTDSKLTMNTAGTSGISIGLSDQANGFWYNYSGKVDDIRIYNRALDSTEVQALYHEGGYDLPKTTLPTNGLVAWYPFTGNAMDSSGNGNNGTVYGATLTNGASGINNTAYNFNGNNSYVSLPSPFFNGQRESQFTVSVTFKLNSLPTSNNNYTIWQKNGFWQAIGISVNFDGSINFGSSIPTYQYQGCSSSQNVIQPNKWYTATIIYNNTTCTINLNGVNIPVTMSTNNQGGALISNTMAGFCDFGEYAAGNSNATNLLGCSNSVSGGNQGFFNGNLDNFLLYNRVLDSSEVQALYHEGGYATLPVKLTNIEATNRNGIVAISWQTSTETNTANFNIQHSTDGNSFTSIGTVKATGSGANGYSFTDTHPTNGTNYYRLESVDKDGASTFSKVVSCEWLVVSKQFTVVPNPARDIVTVKGNHIAFVQVVDNIGRVLKTVSFKDATNPTLSVGGLPKGVYHLRVETIDGKVSGSSLMVSD